MHVLGLNDSHLAPFTPALLRQINDICTIHCPAATAVASRSVKRSPSGVIEVPPVEPEYCRAVAYGHDVVINFLANLHRYLCVEQLIQTMEPAGPNLA